MTAAFITGLSGQTLTSGERAFLRDMQPAGLILFARNIDTPSQVKALIAEALDAIGSPALVLIDQEGGRVQRLRPPHWRALPSGNCYGPSCVAFEQAVLDTELVSRLIAHDLRALGITCNCTPVLDLPVLGAHDIIGNRALGRDPNTIATLGRAIAEGHMAGGVVPVIKHIPGHGRATADSHLELPTVTTDPATLEATD
ncbi:MAG: glycoside hydrolase family 3 N-terminal domain-containing protein, partial [Hyphomicrobiaceae bacterium]